MAASERDARREPGVLKELGSLGGEIFDVEGGEA